MRVPGMASSVRVGVGVGGWVRVRAWVRVTWDGLLLGLVEQRLDHLEVPVAAGEHERRHL